MEPLVIPADEIRRISAVTTVKVPMLAPETTCAEMRQIEMDGVTFDAIVIAGLLESDPIAFIHLQTGLLFELLPTLPYTDEEAEAQMATLAAKSTLEETFNM